MGWASGHGPMRRFAYADLWGPLSDLLKKLSAVVEL